MKKKKLLLPLAVMTLSCGIAAGILTGCGGHKHNFTEWGYDDSGHWQICVEDGEKSEKKDHVFGPDDKCECGAQKPKYGTASGQVKLWKMGEFVTDYAGVTLDTGEDDGIEIDFDPTTGEFEITNARVGKSYTLTISKTGYVSYSTTLEVVEDENSVIGGSTGCVLNYDMFDFVMGWGQTEHDFSKVNDEHAQIACNKETLNVLTKEAFHDVATSLTIKEANSRNGEHTQGIWMKFEDGKYLILRSAKIGEDYRLTFRPEQWSAKSWLENEINFHYLTEEETAAMKSEDGIEVQLVRKGGRACVYLAGELVYVYDLPEEYATQKAQTGFWDFDSAENAVWDFEITETLPVHASTVELKTSVPDDATGVKIALDKETYSLGDDVTLTVTLPAEGYIVSAITLNGESVLSRFQSGKLTFVALQEKNTLVVTVVERRYADVEVNVTGKKYDVTGNSLEGKEITLKGQGGLDDVKATVTGGKIVKTQVAQGTYSAQVEGYKSVEVVVGESGIEAPIVFEYDGFGFLENITPTLHDFTNANAENSSVKMTGNGTLNILTKDSYTNVSASLKIKYNNSSNGMRTQGIVLKFEDGKHLIVRYHNGDQANGNIQYCDNAWNSCPKDKTLFGADAGLNQWGEAIQHTLLSAETAAIKADGLYLTCVLKDGKLYTFFNDQWIATYNLPEGYAQKKVQIGFFTWDTVKNSVVEFKITKTLPSLASTVELETNAPTGVDGIDVALDKTACTFGDTVTLTVTLPAEGYIVSAVTLNGESVLDRLSKGKLTFTAMQAENTVAVTVIAVAYADVTNVSVTGKKYDVTGNSLANGTTVTFKGQGGLADVTFTVTDGKINKTNVVQGTYTAYVEGYKPLANVVVGANGIETALVFEYEDAFDLIQGWGQKNLDQQNDGYLKGSNETESLLTEALYRDVAFTVYLSGAYSANKIDGGNQGIAFRFDGGGYVLVRMEGKQKIQFAKPEWWQKGDAAEGADWNDMIFFQTGDKYLQAYAAGTLKLTVVRRGVTFYAFLNDEYIGCQKVADKYAEVGAHVGIYWTGTTNGAYKTWKYEMSETLPSLASAVELTKNAPTGVDGIEVALDKTACTFGDTVTLTVTLPAEGYVISDITLNGESVLDRLSNGKLTFTAMKAQNTVVVTVVAAEYADVTDVSVTGKKYDVTGNSIAEGTTVTLKGIGGRKDVTFTVTDGKIAKTHVVQGTYTAYVEGYKPLANVVVGENGIATALVFEYDAFGFLENYDTGKHDFTNANAENSTVKMTGKGSLNILTKDSYTNVSASLKIKYNNSSNGMRTQGIVLKFEDGKHLVVRYHNGDQENGNIQYVNKSWDSCPTDKTLFGADAGLNQWGEAVQHTLTSEETTAIKADGLYLTCVLKDGVLYTFFNDQLIATYSLPAEYAQKNVQIGFFTWDAVENSVAEFSITKTLPVIPEATAE